MNLCHCIKLTAKNEMSHLVCAQQDQKKISFEKYLRPLEAVKLSFYPFLLAPFIEERPDEISLTLGRQAEILLAIKIVDDEEKKPLLIKTPPGLTVLLIADVIEGVQETLQACSLNLDHLSVDHEKNVLNLKFILPAGFSNEWLLSYAIIIRTAIDALLFVRGLRVEQALVTCLTASEEAYPWNLPALKAIFQN